MSDTILPLQSAVEQALSARIANEPGFLEQLVLDPDPIVKRLITELVGDDGEVDVSNLNIAVHLQTPTTAHFVVDVAPLAEVSGFALGGSWRDLKRVGVQGSLGMGPVITAARTDGTETTCASDPSCCKTNCPDEDGFLRTW